VNLGFSGSRKGMNPFQEHWFARMVTKLAPTVLHHGACEGADYMAANYVHNNHPKTYIFAYPPTNQSYLSQESLQVSQVIRSPQDYLVRNDAIVAACDLLIATPAPGSRGTRYTIQKAKGAKKPVIIIEFDRMQAFGV
jgi:hypothetical protein